MCAFAFEDCFPFIYLAIFSNGNKNVNSISFQYCNSSSCAAIFNSYQFCFLCNQLQMNARLMIELQNCIFVAHQALRKLLFSFLSFALFFIHFAFFVLLQCWLWHCIKIAILIGNFSFVTRALNDVRLPHCVCVFCISLCVFFFALLFRILSIC